MFGRVLNMPQLITAISRYSCSYFTNKKTLRGVCKTLLSIYDGTFCENSQRLLVVKYFHKTLHLRCLAVSEHASNTVFKFVFLCTQSMETSLIGVLGPAVQYHVQREYKQGKELVLNLHHLEEKTALEIIQTRNNVIWDHAQVLEDFE